MTDTQSPSPSPADRTARRSSRSKRPGSFLASLAAAALLAGTGGVAVGHAWGAAGHAPSDAAATSDTGQTWWAGSGTGSGYGDWGSWSGPDGFETPLDPPQQSTQRGTGAATTRAATDSETVGLVRISTTNAYDGTAAAGTGMILTRTGEVVTNHHVVEGATSVTATVMATGRSYPARVVGTDAHTDIAVLQLRDASDLATVTPATTAATRGEQVTAVGDAGGSTGGFTAAPGTVTALHRAITTEAEGDVPAEHLTGLLQLSSDVAPGDSGGPTYDDAGHVVGMTTAASQGGPQVEGYAVPVATVLRIARDLDSSTVGPDYTYGRPAFLGVGLSDGAGTTLQQVYDGTPAAAAGLRPGDEIIRVGGVRVQGLAALEHRLGAARPGDRVRLAWRSGGIVRTATVTLAAGPVG